MIVVMRGNSCVAKLTKGELSALKLAQEVLDGLAKVGFAVDGELPNILKTAQSAKGVLTLGEEIKDEDEGGEDEDGGPPID